MKKQLEGFRSIAEILPGLELPTVKVQEPQKSRAIKRNTGPTEAQKQFLDAAVAIHDETGSP